MRNIANVIQKIILHSDKYDCEKYEKAVSILFNELNAKLYSHLV